MFIFIRIKHLIGNVSRYLTKQFKKMASLVRRLFLNNSDFTIISDNCWGGFIYQRYDLRYRTPTIGLFFYPQDYIRFLENMEHYLNLELVVTDRSSSKYADINPERQYPIGILDDVEIQFLHYHSKDEVISKWNERKQRINFDNCLVKMSNRNSMFTKDIYERFEKLPFQNKIMFTYEDVNYPSCVIVPEFASIIDQNISEIPYTLKHCNIRRLLNGMHK